MPDDAIAVQEQLWEIKNRNGHTVGQMADEAGMNEVTLWRVMHGQRRPNFDTLTALLRAFPQVAAIFAPPDSPNGKESIPDGTAETLS